MKRQFGELILTAVLLSAALSIFVYSNRALPLAAGADIVVFVQPRIFSAGRAWWFLW